MFPLCLWTWCLHTGAWAPQAAAGILGCMERCWDLVPRGLQGTGMGSRVTQAPRTWASPLIPGFSSLACLNGNLLSGLFSCLPIPNLCSVHHPLTLHPPVHVLLICTCPSPIQHSYSSTHLLLYPALHHCLFIHLPVLLPPHLPASFTCAPWGALPSILHPSAQQRPISVYHGSSTCPPFTGSLLKARNGTFPCSEAQPKTT